MSSMITRFFDHVYRSVLGVVIWLCGMHIVSITLLFQLLAYLVGLVSSSVQLGLWVFGAGYLITMLVSRVLIVIYDTPDLTCDDGL